MTSDITFLSDRNFRDHDRDRTCDHRHVYDAHSSDEEVQEFVVALQTMVQRTCALLSVEYCRISLLDPSRSSFLTLSSLRKPDTGVQYVPHQPGASIESWVVENRTVLLVDDIEHDPLCKQFGLSFSGSLLCVPLMRNKICSGVLAVYSDETFFFDEPKVSLLSLFTEQIVMTLDAIKRANTASRRAAESTALNQSMGRANFLSMITHELRSPLNAINGYLELVLSGAAGALNEQQIEFVRRARSGSEHLYALLEDLLLLSRVDSGQMRLNREIILLPEIVENAVEELELTAADHGISIHVEIAKDFPRMYADAVRVQQILRNLISNALNFTPSGGEVTISATISAATTRATPASPGQDLSPNDEDISQVVCLQVRDTGCGIAPEYHEQIFERFFQVPDGSIQRSGGQGLGLAIVKMIAELHAGHIRIESTPGQGSIFTCELPGLLQ
jgi:signal transduction histidine kinase